MTSKAKSPKIPRTSAKLLLSRPLHLFGRAAHGIILGYVLGLAWAIFSDVTRLQLLKYDTRHASNANGSTEFRARTLESNGNFSFCRAPKMTRELTPIFRPNCILVPNPGPHSLVVKVSLDADISNCDHVEVTISMTSRTTTTVLARKQINLAQSDQDHQGNARSDDSQESARGAIGLEYRANGLLADTDYVLHVSIYNHSAESKRAVCRTQVSTRPLYGNLVQNSGFEDRGDAWHPATRFQASNGLGARRWTPFYNGGFRISCGVIPMGFGKNRFHAQPKVGRCCAHFGAQQAARRHDRSVAQPFFGAHQAIAVPPKVRSLLVTAWVLVTPDGSRVDKKAESVQDSLSMAIGWQLEDGSLRDASFIPLEGLLYEERKWKRVCVYLNVLRSLRMMHLYFHLHDRAMGEMLVDEVAVYENTNTSHTDVGQRKGCHFVFSLGDEKQEMSFSANLDRRFTPEIHLWSSSNFTAKELTLAVPLTVDRILRLEMVAQAYNGGPLTAVALVRSRADVDVFYHVWKSKSVLRSHVNVVFVYISSSAVESNLIPINALRNLAVQASRTEFVSVLDVDMIPSKNGFSCFQDPNGSTLSLLIPEKHKILVTMPVFINRQHARNAREKDGLLANLENMVAVPYCSASQKAAKIAKWKRVSSPFQVRFATDYEPFAIGRRSNYLAYDERFVGYGFNKISWALETEMHGFRLLSKDDCFLTHLNHMENEWVSDIHVPAYLRTWRRYLAFVAETTTTHAAQHARFIP